MPTPIQKRKPKNKKLLTGSLLLLILLITGGVLIYQHHVRATHELEQKQVMQLAETRLEDKSATIQLKFGTPNDFQKIKTCKHTSSFNEGSLGTLYCQISYSMNYSVNDQSNASSLATKIESTIGDKGTVFKLNDINQSEVPPISVGKGDYQIKQVDCSDGFTYFTASQDMKALGYDAYKLAPGSNGLLIELVCTLKPAQKSIY